MRQPSSHPPSWRSLKNLSVAIDTSSAPTSIEEICNPAVCSLSEAIRRAKLRMESSKGFVLSLAKFLQVQSFGENLPTALRGLDVLEAIAEEEQQLLTVLRFFLRSEVPQVISKCVLILGRRCQQVDWMRSVMAESDGRIRANLIESLWARSGEPEIKLIMQEGLKDRNHRVAANSVYGIFLAHDEGYREGLNQLISNSDPAFRRAGIWVIRMIGNNAASQIKPLILDPSADVRKAAFAALVLLRNKQAEGKKIDAEPGRESQPTMPSAQMLASN